MLKFAAILCLALGTLTVRAQLTGQSAFPGGFRVGSGAAMHASVSGQFEIRDPDNTGGNPVPLGKDTNVHYVRIDPGLLAVSCERIKHAVLTEINAPDNWRDKIIIDLRHARTLNETIIIDTEPFGRNWSYHVSLPDTVESTRLVTSMVDVLLLEMANHNARRSAEIPLWLGYGLTQDILRSTHIELVLEPPKVNARGLKISTFSFSSANTNSLAIAHADLQTRPPLTLEQLSWPDDARLDGPEGETYRSSAQLFVHELLELRGGRTAMQAFIRELPQHLNWQLSFLHAFHGDFASQLDLEKWWALRLVDFTGRDISRTLSPEESWQKLDEIVRPVVDIRTRANELPLRTEMPLQTIIEKWNLARQTELLREKSKLLYQLRSRASQESAKLVDDYRRTIDVYLDKRAQQGYLQTPRAQVVFGIDRVGQQTIEDLNILDSIREDLRPKPVVLQSADADGNVNH